MLAGYVSTLPNTPLHSGYNTIADYIKDLPSTVDDYPQYDTYSSKNYTYIDLAVPGFSKRELNAVVEKDVLIITGYQDEELDDDIKYRHTGIAKRDFIKEFPLAKNAKVEHITYIDGILHMRLFVETPEEDLPKTITINS